MPHTQGQRDLVVGDIDKKRHCGTVARWHGWICIYQVLIVALAMEKIKDGTEIAAWTPTSYWPIGLNIL